MVEATMIKQASQSGQQDRRSLLHRIYDFRDSGLPVVTVGINKQTNEPIKKTVKEAFPLKWAPGTPFTKEKPHSKELLQIANQLNQQQGNIYGRLQNALEVLKQTTPQKWMSGKNELNLLKLCNVSEKPDQLTRVVHPDRRVLESLSDERLDVLLMFLNEDAQRYRAEFRQTNSQDPQKIPNFRNALSIIGSCFCKLIWEKANMLMSEASKNAANLDKINDFCEQLTLCSDLFNAFAIECASAFNTVATQSMLYFSHLAVQELKVALINRKEIPLGMTLVAEQVIYSSMSLVATLISPEAYPQVQTTIDETLFARGTQILKIVLQLVPNLQIIFCENLCYPDHRGMIAGLPKTQKSRSLLKIALSVTTKALANWQENLKNNALKQSTQQQLIQKEMRKIFDNFQALTLQAINTIESVQIKYYSKTEKIALEPEPAKLDSQEEIKVQKTISSNAMKMAAIEEADEDEDEDEEEPKSAKPDLSKSKPSLMEEIKEEKSTGIKVGNTSMKHTSAKIISDTTILNIKCDLDANILAFDETMQRNWISVNHDIFEIARRLLPSYYQENAKSTEKKKEETGFEKLPAFIDMEAENSYLSQVCSLFKVQFYFLLRYNHYNTYSRYQRADKTSELQPDSDRQTCNLTLSIRKFFQMIGNDLEFNQQMLSQIFDVCKVMIEEKAFHVVDKNHYFQVLWLHQMIVELGYLGNEGDLDVKCLDLVKILYVQFKSFFVEDKYLQLLESVFELDMQQLYYIEKQYQDGKSDLTMIKLNRFLIQRYCMTLMIRMSKSNQQIALTLWGKIQEEFGENGLCYAIGKSQSDTYDETNVEIPLPGDKGNFIATEHRHKTTRSLFKTEIYMVIKMAMGLLGFGDFYLNSRYAYHTLTEHSQHWELFHNGQHPIRFGPKQMAGGQMNADLTIGDQTRKCEDCLRCQFNVFKLPLNTDPVDLAMFWKFIFDKIKILSASLRNQEQAKDDFFNPEGADLISAVTAVGRTPVPNKPAPPRKTDTKVPIRNFKITEKIYSLLKRFIIYVAQNKNIAEYFSTQFIKQPEKEEKDLRKVNLKTQPKREDSKQLTGQDLKEIQRDEAFKLLLMRNIIFHIRFKPPEATDQIKFLLEFVSNTFRQIKFNLNLLVKSQDQYLNKEREKNTLTNVFQLDLDGSTAGKQPQIPGGQTRAEWLQDKVSKFREMADISNSLLNLYINVVCKNQSSLTFLERGHVLGVTIVLLRKIVFVEGSFAVEFIDELLSAFFFEKLEELDPFKLVEPPTQPTLTLRNLYVYNPSPITLTQQSFQEQLLKLIFDSVIEFIRVTKEELLINLDQRKEFRLRAIAMVRLLVRKLHDKMFNKQHANYFALKFSQSFKKDCIGQIKKIMIFIREQGQLGKEETGRDVHKTDECMWQLRQVLIRVLSVMPRPQQMRDFFTFFREIFYYQKRLDEVDHMLANDLLQILNGVLKKRTEQLSLDVTQISPNDAGNVASLVPAPGSFQLKVADSFQFSRFTPGTFVLNNLKFSNEPAFGFLFKVDRDQLMMEAQDPSRTTPLEVDMVVFSLLQKYDYNPQQTQAGWRTLDIKLRIKEIRDQSRIRLQYQLVFQQSAEVIERSESAKFRDLDGQWHFLCVRVKKSTFANPTMEFYMDSFERENQNNMQVTVRGLDVDKYHYLALGNNADILYRFTSGLNYLSKLTVKTDKDKKRKEEAKDDKIYVTPKEYIKLEKQIMQSFELGNTQYFRGQISLPFFMLKVSDMQKYIMSDNVLGRAFRDQMIEFISNKKVLNHDGMLDLNYLVFKIIKQIRAINQITESANSKAVFSTYETTEEELTRNFTKEAKKNPQYQIKQFQSLDKYTMQVIHIHNLAVQQRALFAVHQRAPAEVFTLLGGFKNLYPLVTNVIKSNLGQLNQLNPGQVLSWVFVILNTLLHTEPSHISQMVKKRNMLLTLKHILLELGRKQMISVDLINQLKNIVKRNVLARFRFVRVQDRPEYLTQRYINTANGTCRAHSKFYQDFLYDFVTEILLDEDLAVQECYFISTQPAQAQKRKDSFHKNDKMAAPIEPTIQSHFIIEELIDLIQNICCPPEMKTILHAQLQQKESHKHSADEGYIDYESLREFIVERIFTSKIVAILQMEQLQHIKHLPLLQKLGKCIADTIIHGQESENLRRLLTNIQTGWRAMSLIRLKVYLLIILRVIRETGFKQKDNELVVVLQKEFKPREIAKILNQWNEKQIIDEEQAILQDEIISTVLLILTESYIKNKQENKRNDQLDNINQQTRMQDAERKELIQMFQQELKGNQVLRENAYFTLMFIAFEKKKVREINFYSLPKIDDIILMIKTTKLRADSLDPTQQRSITTTFDIDFFFLAVEMFRKYNIYTKRIFLTHLHSFLISHQTAFMQIFEDLNRDDNMLKRKLLDFFFMIITDCITSRDSEIHRYAENILVEVLFFQLMSTHPDTGATGTSFVDQQMSSFVSTTGEQPAKKSSALTSADYDGHKLITQIFMFFKNDNNQFQILIRLLHKLFKHTFGWEEDPAEKERLDIIRLNLKLLQLIQIVEQVFVHKPFVALNEFFIEAMVIMMFLLDKLRILDFVLPDRITETFADLMLPQQPQQQNITLTIDEQRKMMQSQGSGLKQTPGKPGVTQKAGTTSSIKNLAELGMPLRNAQNLILKEEITTVKPAPVVQPQVSTRKFRPATSKMFQFLKGGSLRALFHMIVKGIYLYGETMQSGQMATYMDMLRFLFTKEIRGHFRSILQKHPDFEENLKAMKQGELKDVRLLKLNAINKADVILFILKDNEKTPNRSDGSTVVSASQSVKSGSDGSARMRQDQAHNTCWKIHNRDKSITPQWETFSGIRDTLKLQRDDYEGAIVYRNLKYSTEQLGCPKTVFGILPGISMVKGFCVTMILGELVEVLNGLLYPQNVQPSQAQIQTELKKIKQVFDDDENSNGGSSMEMAFEEEKNSPLPTEPLPRSFKQQRSGGLEPLLEGLGEKLSKEEIFKKVNDILFFIYEIISEQLFHVPLPVSRNDRRTMATGASTDQQHQYSFTQDFSQDAGKVFWDQVDPVIKKKLEAQVVYAASQGDGYTVQQAKQDVNLMCCQTQVVDPTRKHTSDLAVDLTSSTEPFDAEMRNKFAGLGLPVASEVTMLEEEDPTETTERQRFVKQYMQSSNFASIDVSPIKDFITHLYQRLHKIYGKNTKVLYNEFGGFDFKDNKTGELVTEFNNFRLRFTYEFSEICDYMLTHTRMITIAFAAVSSDMFRDEIVKVYQAADQSVAQQQQEEAAFEQTRKDALQQNIRRGMPSNFNVDSVNTLNISLQTSQTSQEETKSSFMFESRKDVEYKIPDKMPKRDTVFRLDYIYTKKHFNKIVKWCMEDPSNIWCDQLEQEILDFQEVKAIYNKDILNPQIKTAESERVSHQNKMLKEYTKSEDPRQIKFINDYKVNYGEIFVNPQFHQSFMKLRMQQDRWGRRMLIKPNRKFHEGEHLMYYKFVAHDYINKWFSVSLLDDGEQPDCVVPEGQTEFMLQEQSGGEASTFEIPKMIKTHSEMVKSDNILNGEEKPSTKIGDKLPKEEEEDPFELAVKYFDDPKTLDNFMQPKFSRNLQKMRSDLLSRLDRSRMLQSVMFNDKICRRKPDPVTIMNNQEKELKRREKERLWLQGIQKQERLVPEENMFSAEMFYLKLYYGTIVVTNDFFAFFSFGLTCNKEQRKFNANWADFNGECRKLIYRWHEIEEIMVKPFFGPSVGVEIYLTDKKSFAFNLMSAAKLKHFLKRVRQIKDQKITRKIEFNIVEDPVEAFKQCGFAESWKLGEKSNQEFLLLLNKYSGRTFNFISQYPFFPHVLTDFTSSLIEFHDNKQLNKVYRDFNRPSTNMFEKKDDWWEGYTQDKNELICAPIDSGYQLQYSHGYSDALRVANFQIRLEPFTSNYLALNGVPENCDRIHISNQWMMGALEADGNAFCCELLPEFFYLPELFTNENLIHCGGFNTQSQNVDQWYLPKWAINHYDLVRVMRESLESKYVQENLGFWIDLVFGCDQFKEEKRNQFYPWIYPKWWDDRSSDLYKLWERDFSSFESNAHWDINDPELETQMAYNISIGFLHPYKLFQNSIMNTEKEKGLAIQEDPTAPNFSALEERKLEDTATPGLGGKKGGGANIDNLINHFVANIENATRSELKLNRCADHQPLEHYHDIVHMIIISQQKQCLAFLRIDDRNPKFTGPNSVATGKIVVYLSRVNISNETFLINKPFDLFLRHEHVHHELDNIFAEFSCKHDRCVYKEQRYLYVCGYLDNSIKIFDLKKKPGEHLVKELKFNNARVTCIKFSKDYKYLITCDADGVIHQYEKNCHMTDYADIDMALTTTVFAGKCNQEKLPKKKEHFPFTLLNVFQDQMDEIVALDINDTLDMFVTLSRDGTIALRCLRTGKLWRHFKLLYKLETKGQDDKVVTIKGYIKNFKHVNALKLSLHGYIVVCGPSSRQPNVSQYLVYSINGDLLRAALEKVEIKNVFLNSREDQLIIATNFANPSSADPNIQNVNGNLRVLNLYGLEKIANLTKVVYIETINFLQNDNSENMQMQRGGDDKSKQIPSIQAMVVGQAERNMNIFFVKKQIDNRPGAKPKAERENKEIICFDSGMDAVWSHFKNYGIAR